MNVCWKLWLYWTFHLYFYPASGEEPIFDAPTQLYANENEVSSPANLFDSPKPIRGTTALGSDDETDNEAVEDDDIPTQAYPAFDGASPTYEGPTQAYGDEVI